MKILALVCVGAGAWLADWRTALGAFLGAFAASLLNVSTVRGVLSRHARTCQGSACAHVHEEYKEGAP